MDEMRSFVDDLYGGGYLEHYGVKGMKWRKHSTRQNNTNSVSSRSAAVNIDMGKLVNQHGKTSNAIIAKRLETAARQQREGIPSKSKAPNSKVRNAIARGKNAVNGILKAISNGPNLGNKKVKKKSSNSKNKGKKRTGVNRPDFGMLSSTK